MSSIDELRSKFYDDHGDDPITARASTSTSTSALPPRSASASISAPRRPSTATSLPRSAAAPYPPPLHRDRDRSTRKSTPVPNANANANARTRARAAPDDDPLGGLGLIPATRDPDPDLGLGVDDAANTLTLTDMDVDGDGDAHTARGLRAREAREARESDIQRLTRAWQDERHAPDILPARDVLLGRVLDALRRQTSDANALRTAAALSEEDHYMTMLVQTEVERVKFVVRSYIRTRLFKIEQYPAYITSNTDVQARLTHAELRHAQRYAELLVAQFRTTVLDHLPPTQQALDDEVLTMPSMTTEPNKDKPVFVHAFDAIEHLLLSDGTTQSIPRGAVVLVPYRVIEQHLLRGEVELV